jgi:hypothetical protein
MTINSLERLLNSYLADIPGLTLYWMICLFNFLNLFKLINKNELSRDLLLLVGGKV